MDVIKIALTSVAGALLALKLKQYQNEYSIYLVLAAGVLMLFFCLDALEMIMDLMNRLGSVLKGQNWYLKLLAKLVGIAYVCEFASDICVDAGYQSLSHQVQILGKLAILVSAIPLFTSLIDTIEEVFS